MDVLLSLMRVIKEFHATLPDQPRPNPTAPWLEFGEGNGTPVQPLIGPILLKETSNVNTQSDKPEIGISGSPRARAVDWAFTRRCATTGSRVMLI